MSLINLLSSIFHEPSKSDDMVRYYRIEHGREWRQYETMNPNFTAQQIADICFK